MPKILSQQCKQLVFSLLVARGIKDVAMPLSQQCKHLLVSYKEPIVHTSI